MKENRCTIRRYDPLTDREVWDQTVDKSRNGTFLFRRDYMDYHADRFEDYSLIADIRGHKALLPACQVHTPDGGRELHSHSGLTYGGWVLPAGKLDGTDVLQLYETLITLAGKENFSAIIIKPVPYIYHSSPSQEEEYALWRCGARLEGVNLASVIERRRFSGFDYMHRRYLSHVSAENPQISRLYAGEIAPFHSMLTACLHDRYHAAPLHTLKELQLLMERFPEQIRVYVLRNTDGQLHAGVCLYLTGQTAHCQYIGCTEEGRRHRYLSWLFHTLIEEFADIPYFDFGTSNEAGGRVLNPSLHAFKFGHGAGSVIYPAYRITL